MDAIAAAVLFGAYALQACCPGLESAEPRIGTGTLSGVPYEDCWDCCVKETKHLDYDVA